MKMRILVIFALDQLTRYLMCLDNILYWIDIMSVKKGHVVVAVVYMYFFSFCVLAAVCEFNK